MKNVFEAETRRELRDRLTRLDPRTPPRWGRMTAPKMVCHLVESARMALGDLPVAPKWVPVRYPPLKQLFLYVIPIPKGMPTAPELVARVPDEWEADVRSLLELLDRVGAKSPGDAWPDHPAFGAMTGAMWGVLVYRHSDHHLRQFGV